MFTGLTFTQISHFVLKLLIKLSLSALLLQLVVNEVLSPRFGFDAFGYSEAFIVCLLLFVTSPRFGIFRLNYDINHNDKTNKLITSQSLMLFSQAIKIFSQQLADIQKSIKVLEERNDKDSVGK